MGVQSAEQSAPLTGRVLFGLLAIGLIVTTGSWDWLLGHSLSRGLTLPFLTSFSLAAGVGYWAVPLLKRLKAGQIIREDGPQAHLQKSGTPTMGGIFFLPPAIGVALLWTGLALDFTSQDFLAVAVTAALTVSYGLIGWLDDWQILRRKSNKGISPRLKLTLQIGFSSLFCLWLFWNHPELTTLQFPFGWGLPLGLLFWPLAWFVPVAQSNATNLTDGVDGLAAGTGAIALLALGVLVAPIAPGLMILCVCLSGGYLGFLVHNHNPARVFMGDTGSLALGGALAGIGLLSNMLWALLLVSGLFLLETLSVIAQVWYYKATKGPDGVGKRLLKMAPFHHHLELSGWSETQVVAFFYGVNALLALLCLFLP